MKNTAAHVELEGPRFEEAIRREAYCLWKLDGCPDGRDLDHWFRAKEIIQRRVDEDLGPLPEIPNVVLNVRTTSDAPPATGNPMPASAMAPSQTIAHTLAEHQNDPSHRFHARGTHSDSRTSVSSGGRMQRVRSRAQAN